MCFIQTPTVTTISSGAGLEAQTGPSRRICLFTGLFISSSSSSRSCSAPSFAVLHIQHNSALVALLLSTRLLNTPCIKRVHLTCKWPGGRGVGGGMLHQAVHARRSASVWFKTALKCRDQNKNAVWFQYCCGYSLRVVVDCQVQGGSVL